MLGPQTLGGEVQQQGRLLMLQRALDQPGRQGGEVVLARHAVAEEQQDLPEMVGAGVCPVGIVSDGGAGHLELGRQVRQDHWRGVLEIVGNEAQVPERAELEREAQPVAITASLAAVCEVRGIERVIGGQLRFRYCRRPPSQAAALQIAQKARRHSSGLQPHGRQRGRTIRTASRRVQERMHHPQGSSSRRPTASSRSRAPGWV